jgi:hypothetical protein
MGISFSKIMSLCNELVQEGAKSLALDLLYNMLDYYRENGMFGELDSHIEELEPCNMETLITIGVFTHTCAWRKELPALRDFYSRAREWLESIEPERFEALLMGFEYE